MWFIVVCTLTDNEYVSTRFPNIFSYCFCLNEFVRVQAANLHNAERAFFKSESVFSVVKTNIYFIFDIVVKKTNRMWLSVVCTLIDNDTRHHSGQNVVRLVSPH